MNLTSIKVTRFLIIFLFIAAGNLSAQKTDSTLNQKSGNQQAPTLPPCEDCPGGGGDNISVENIVLTLRNQDSLLMNATIVTSFAANTVFTYYWKINNGSVQSGTATKAELANKGLYIGSLGLTRGQTYSFGLKVDYGSTSSLWDDLATNFSYSYFDPEPAAQPTSMVFTSVTVNSMTVGWTAASGSPTGYLVIRSTASPTGVPIDGTTYTAGSSTLGNGTVVYIGNGTSFSSTGLTIQTPYHYSIFSYNGSGAGINYRSISPLTSSQSTLSAVLTVTSPNGAEVWGKGRVKNITWSTNISGGNVKIQYYRYPGDVYTDIAASVLNNGTYAWTIPSSLANGNDYRVSVQTLAAPFASDESNANFTIQTDLTAIQQPSANISTTKGSTLVIQYSSNFTDAVAVDLVGPVTYSVNSNAASSATLNYVLPSNMVNGDYRVRITCNGNASAVMTGSALITVSDPYLSITDPKTDTYLKNYQLKVKWLDNINEQIRIDLLNQGTVQQTITTVTDVAATEYYWTIPTSGITNGDYQIKITGVTSGINATSDPFTISSPQITVLSPIGGLTGTPGGQINIQWSANLLDPVKIELLRTGASPIVIASSVGNTALDQQNCAESELPEASAKHGGPVLESKAHSAVIENLPPGEGGTPPALAIASLCESISGTNALFVKVQVYGTLVNSNYYNPSFKLTTKYKLDNGSFVTVGDKTPSELSSGFAINFPANTFTQGQSYNLNVTVTWSTTTASENISFDYTLFLTHTETYVWTIPNNPALYPNSSEYQIKVTNLSNTTYTTTSSYFAINDKRNFVLSQTILKELVTTDAQVNGLLDNEISQAIAYSDGMGRLSQSIAIKASPLKKDIVSPVEYDTYGRQSKSYLPYVSQANTGYFQQSAISDQLAFYRSAATYAGGIDTSWWSYAITKYENSPLNRVLEQGSVGTVWRVHDEDFNGHTVKSLQRSNTATEVRKWAWNGSPDGYFAEGEIIVTEVTDENNVKSWTFEDKSGKTIKKKSMKGAEEVLTYYVYDDFGNLKYILPPECVKALPADGAWATGDLKDKWVTQFWYDSENRLTVKKIPEADSIFTVYDRLGRVALTQDGKLRAGNKWMFTKYDIMGRPIITGLYTHSAAAFRNDMQILIDSKTVLYETRAQSPLYHFYTNNAFPSLDNCEIWTVTYYDDYDFDNNGTADSTYKTDAEYTDTHFERLKGKVTETKVRILSDAPTGGVVVESSGLRVKPEYRKAAGGVDIRYNPSNPTAIPASEYYNAGQWLTTVVFYDKYGRVIQTQSTNTLQGQDVSWTSYDFPGKVLKTKTIHKTPGQTVTVKKRFDYDHTGRLVKTYEQNNTDSEILLAKNSYNELGTLIKKELHSTNNGTSFLQAVDYSYNIRGWMIQINNPNDLNDPQNSGHPDLFAMKLNYEQVNSTLTGSAQYNGNISQQIWKTGTLMNGYGYAYDQLNQLTAAIYESGTNFDADYDKYSEKNITYDLNGNIKTMQRYAGVSTMVDNLNLTMNGNKLIGSDDGILTTVMVSDFEDRGSTYSASNVEYVYDINGNMIQDKNKGITNIEYNYLNLPTKVYFAGNNRIEWVYTSGGAKLRKTVYTNGSITLTQDYVSGFVFKNSSLDFFSTDQGRVKRKSNGSLQYQYNLTDHLGNVRTTFADTNVTPDGAADVIEYSAYYAFGMRIEGTGLSSSNLDNKFTYNGKELEDDFGLGWYHYGARFYDAQLGRWHVIDPVDEFHSPYTFVHNDPVNYQDKDGNFERPIHGQITSAAFTKLNEKYGDLPGSLGTLSDRVINAVQAIDLKGAMFDYHFDSRANFQDVQATFAKLDVIINNWNFSSTDRLGTTSMGAVAVLGSTLHTIQDFYSHSNYVELYVDFYMDTYKELPSSVPIFTEGVKISDFKTNYLEGNLKTGEFGAIGFVWNGLKSLLGFGVDQNSHQAMNKDSFENSPYFHTLAKDAATRHTEAALEQTIKSE